MSKIGEKQFKAFWMGRLVTCKIPVSNPILLNLPNLLGNPNKATGKDSVLREFKFCFDGEIKEGRLSTK